jgi:alkaline phosphatase D
MSSPTLTRRKLLADSATLTAGALIAPHLKGQQSSPAPEFVSQWENDLDRVWLGADFWANPMQDWQVKDGRAECLEAKPNRNVHVLTRQLGDHSGDLHMKVRIGRVGGGSLAGNGKGSAGFKIGILGTLRDHPELRDYRNNLAFSSGWDVGFTAAGGLFFGDSRQAEKDAVTLGETEAVELEMHVQPAGASYTLTLTVRDTAGGKVLGELKRNDVRPLQLIGNLAIGCNFGPEMGPRAAAKKKAGAKGQAQGPGLGQFWFSHWSVKGSKVVANEDHRFGPILFNHYTLNNRILKMSAQMPPLGAADVQEVVIETKDAGAEWKAVATASIHPQARTATFEVPSWQDDQDVPYRLAYTLKSKEGETVHHYPGTIRANPIKQEVFSVADISCNIHTAFPNAPYVDSVARLNPDFMAFVGDQFYESTAGYGVQREPLQPAILDYLRKWYFHGWTWRELTRDRPSVSLPDDHDVYQGNLWGMNGAPQIQSQEAGGYQMHPEWVNVVHRTQTAHHPAAYDPEPSQQGIINYYGALTYGGISFAILADRQFKSAPEGNVPPTDSRADHVINPDFDPKTADLPGLELLGAKQLQFLEEWAHDWKGAEMKAVLSQTIFTGMATTHGGEREVLRIDYDQNGWPQAARNAALKAIRKAFAYHIAGDQHLPGLVHYGIDEHRDAGVGFAGPAINVGYQRWWEPNEQVHHRKSGQGLTGDFTDHFGHPMTVLAVKNGVPEPRKDAMGICIDKASGFGMVRFNKKDRTILCECWPFGIDFSQPGAAQFETWPVLSSQLEQYGRKPAAHLPKLSITGAEKPLVEVLDAAGNLVYALRLSTAEFQPHVFSEGKYSVRISHPETGVHKLLEALSAKAGNTEELVVALG